MAPLVMALNQYLVADNVTGSLLWFWGGHTWTTPQSQGDNEISFACPGETMYVVRGLLFASSCSCWLLREAPGERGGFGQGGRGRGAALPGGNVAFKWPYVPWSELIGVLA